MWKNKQDPQPDPNQNPQSPESSESPGFVSELEAAAGAPSASGTSAEQPQPEGAPIPQQFAFVSLISEKAARLLITMPFESLAAHDHAAWLPTEDAIVQAVPSVQGGIEEVLEVIIPHLLNEYASRFPRVAEGLAAIVTLWWTKWFMVRRIKMEEAAAAARAAQARTIDVPVKA